MFPKVEISSLNANKSYTKGHKSAVRNIGKSSIKVNGSNFIKRNINSAEQMLTKSLIKSH